MEKKMKVLTDVEITEDVINSELCNRFGRIASFHEACGGGGCGRYTSRVRIENRKVEEG